MSFQSKMMMDMSGALNGLLGYLGDRLGLFKTLAELGAAPATELATRARVDTRLAAEWLRAMTCAGYIQYSDDRYSLTPEAAVVLTHEGGPFFLGGGYQQFVGFASCLPRVVDAFRDGAGVPQDAYSDEVWDGMERMSATWFENLLVQRWLPLIPSLCERLDSGADVADIGCGSGRALVQMALAFPRSRFVGYDVLCAAVQRAQARMKEAAVDDRVRVEHADPSKGLADRFELITMFDSLHDVHDPVVMLHAVRRALAPNGKCLILELRASDELTENIGPVGAIQYATSVLYNLPVALAHASASLSSLALTPTRIRSLCRQAGFTSIRELPIQNPFHSLYEAAA